MSANAVAVMGTPGFVNDASLKFTHLLFSFMTTDHQQSVLFSGSLHSLSKIMQETSGDPVKCARVLKEHLVNYLMTHYNQVDVSTTVINPQTASANEFQINIQITVVGDTLKVENYSYLLKTASKQFDELVNLLNTGAGL